MRRQGCAGSQVCVALGLFLLLCPHTTRAGSYWYVGPEGKAGNAGTREAAWDIGSALAGRQRIGAGDTVYLLEGTYRRRPEALFEVKLVGEEGKPIVVRPAPGARVRIDGGLSVQGPSAHVWIRDLEIFVSEPVPEEAISPGSHPEDLKRPWGGVHMFGGRSCKYINLIIHHCNQGISCWKGEIDPEIYGCIIYGNGWLGTDRGHGHCIYTQNDEGVKVISNCIMTCRFDGSYTMHAYGSSQAYVNNYLVQQNICYGRGPFLVGGGRPSKGIRAIENYLHGVSMRIGYNAPHNEDCEVRGNVIVDGGLEITKYQDAGQSENLIVGRGQPRPEGCKVVVLANKYEPGRANLAVFNWDGRNTVMVPVTGLLRNGEKFRLMDPQSMFGEPAGLGVCRGGEIEIPVVGEFGVFVLIRAD